MASYKDRLRQGSFRGVEFFIDSSSYEGGKRVKMHEFVGRDVPFTEDLRRKGHVYSVDGYLIGDDVFSQRDQLIRACERSGYGVLVHPYFGILNVEAGALQISENNTEGRIVKFTCQFHEKGEAKNPSSFVNKIGKFFSNINSTLESVQDQFSELFTIASMPEYILNSAKSVVDTATDTFLGVLGQLASPTDYVSGIKASILQFQDSYESLLSEPSSFASEFVGLISDIGATTDSHKNKQEIYDSILSFDDDLASFPDSTDTRTVQQTNQDALVNLVKTATFILAIRDFVAAANNTFPDEDSRLKDAVNDIYFSFDDLEERKADLIDSFNELMTSESNENIYEDLNNLSALMFASLPSPDDVESKIKRVVSYTPSETISSLMVVYDLYESPDNEQDLIDRNGIQNPCFVIGGRELEVLS